MKYIVKNFRGISEATLEGEGIILVSGRNRAGKTSLVAGLAATLSSDANMGVTKKDSGSRHVRRGDAVGRAMVRDYQDRWSGVKWPDCEIQQGEVGGVFSSSYATGLSSVADSDPAERARALAQYINALPSKDDLSAAMVEPGYSQAAMDRIWAITEAKGWDGAAKDAETHGTKLKGQWEGEAGEKYGAKKAEEWKPMGWDESWEGADLGERLNDAKNALKLALKDQGRSEAETEAIKKIAAVEVDLDELKRLVEGGEKLVKRGEEIIEKLPPDPENQGPSVHCPHCGAECVIDHGNIAIPSAPAASAAELKNIRTNRARATGSLVNTKAKLGVCKAALKKGEDDIAAAHAAKKALKEIKGVGGEAGNAAEEAQMAVDGAQYRVDGYNKMVNAHGIHAQIMRNGALIELLRPGGLRRKKLVTALEDVNADFAEASQDVGWEPLRLDESMTLYYGQTPYADCSASEQFRVRVILQIYMALRDRSEVLLIDAADILDSLDRPKLFEFVARAKLPAIITMTLSKPESAENCARVGIEKQYWLENGNAEEVK
jgi:hypothetical protein